MKKNFAVLSVLLGFGFQAASIFIYFDQQRTSKFYGPLISEFLAGYGMLWLHVAYFLVALAALHAACGWAFGFLVEPVARRLGRTPRESARIGLLVFLLAVLWVVLESAWRYPQTLAGMSIHHWLAAGPGSWLRYLLLAVTVLGAASGLVMRLSAAFRKASRPAYLAAALVVVPALLIGGWGATRNSASVPFPNDPQRPHIILIGIDGWRADMLPQAGGAAAGGLMPFVEQLVDGGVWIEEAIAPLARSYPSWWTILTGRYPASHGARFNLIGDAHLRTDLVLNRQLGKLGYFRIFAMDERRFANLREVHGFDWVAGPAVGAADILLGGLNDSPLNNLVGNTRLGAWLFPFSHSNRAAYTTYRPAAFDRKLERALAAAPRRPLFLTVHYELSHWPYQWANGPTGKHAGHPNGQEFGHYMETLEEVDAQIGRLFASLQELGILENAIVVLLSDHGEAFLSDERAWIRPDGRVRLTTPGGHGIHVLGLTQHAVPLVFRRYGGEPLAPRRVPGRASLADVYPTLAEWIGLEPAHGTEGHSLLEVLYDAGAGVPARPIAMETGFNTLSIMAGHIQEGRLVAEATRYYRVTRDGRLELREEFLPGLLESKQRAVLLGPTMLVSLPELRPRLLEADLESRVIHEWSPPEDKALAGPPEYLLEAFCLAFEPEYGAGWCEE